ADGRWPTAPRSPISRGRSATSETLVLTVQDGSGALISFEVDRPDVVTAMALGEFYRRNGTWKFRAVDQGWESGLRKLAEEENQGDPMQPGYRIAHLIFRNLGEIQKMRVPLPQRTGEGYPISVLDFTEIPTGEGFELLVRDMLVAMRYRVSWSGRGADGGKDLLVEEPGDPRFGMKPRLWVVSCKHNALANNGNGRSVSAEDIGSIGGISDTTDEHGASAFLVACSTQPSSGLVTRLATIEARKGVPTYYWDRETLSIWLNTPQCWSVAQRYMPRSAGETRVYATEAPNRWIVIANGHFIRYANRHGSFVEFQINWIEARVLILKSVPLPEGFMLRIRAVFYNDKIGTLDWYIDCLYEDRDFYAIEEPTTESYIADSIREYLFNTDFGDYQINSYEVEMRRVNRSLDSYDPDHYRYYESLPTYI
ncbi:TerD family protein, partial [Nocardia sp. NPDC055049]